MTYTVGEVAKLARISVRTLHHYDEIGLVKPSGRSAAGYRQYTGADLDRLQQVLFFRELELKLEDIAAVLADPAFDRRKVLTTQRALLEQRLDKTRATLALVERTLRALDGEEVMTNQEKFDPAAFEAETEERWGNNESFRMSKERTKLYTPEDWARIRAEQQLLLDDFAVLFDANVPPSDPRAMDVAERARLAINRTFYPCSHAMHASLGQMYVDDPRFAATYERVRVGLASYVRDAIVANAHR